MSGPLNALGSAGHEDAEVGGYSQQAIVRGRAHHRDQGVAELLWRHPDVVDAA